MLRRLALVAVALAGFAGPAVKAAESLTAADFRALDRLIAQRQGDYARCADYICPDVDCAGWGANVDALMRLKTLLGTPQRVSEESTWGEIEARQRSLGYWAEQEDKAQRKLYDDVLSQANRNRRKQDEAEYWAKWQRSAISISKLAQAVADFRSLADLLQKPQGEKFSTLQELLAVGEILNSGANVIELAGEAQTHLRDRGLSEQHGSGPGLSESAAKALSYASLAQQSFASGGNVAQGLEALGLAKSQHARFLELSSAPLQQGQLSKEAMAVRRAELSALQKSAEVNARHASEMARGAAQAGLLAAVKLATIYAEGQQKEMQDRIAEYMLNADAEEKAIGEQAASLENSASRASAMRALTARINGAVDLLSACQKACPGQVPAAAREVPVRQFVMPKSAGSNAGKESYGTALAWFRQAYRAQAAEVAAASSFRIEDGKIKLEGRPASVAVKAPITIGYSGSQCLINRGEIVGDGETRKLVAGSDQVVFSGKEKPGEYAFNYVMEELWRAAGSGRYSSQAMVRVGRDNMLGYWRRTSPIKVRNGRGDIVDWGQGPQNFAIATDDSGSHKFAFLDQGAATTDLRSRFTAKSAPSCSRADAKLSCQFKADAGCAGQWYDFQIEITSDDQARLKVTGGEMTSMGTDGCMTWPHSFQPWDFALAREPVGSVIESANPCPDGYRCR
jgi:hypothetical protein